MNAEDHRFRLGTFDCMIVSDGTFSYSHPDQLLFADAPRDQLTAALADWGIELSTWQTFDSPYPCLLVAADEHKVLIDTGAGAMSPSTGQLVTNLGLLEISPRDIDVVVLTHAHPDHIGGTLDAHGRPAFPNARYVISQNEWDFWTRSPDLACLRLPDEYKAAMLESASTHLPPLAGHLDLIEPDTEIVSGVRAVDAAGHTPGQIAVRIESDDQRLLAVADVVAHPVHVTHPQWCMAVDYAPEATVTTRRRILGLAAAEQALVFAYHIPGLGRVRPRGGAWHWDAV